MFISYTKISIYNSKWYQMRSVQDVMVFLHHENVKPSLIYILEHTLKTVFKTFRTVSYTHLDVYKRQL